MKNIALLISLVPLFLLIACESEKKADEKSEKVRISYEEYLNVIIQQKPFSQYTENVSVKLVDKDELALNIGSTFQYHYQIEVTTNDQFENLSPLDKFEVIYDFKSSLSNVAENPDPDSHIESHDVFYIDSELKHTIKKNRIFFNSEGNSYGAQIRKMSPPEQYEYKGTGQTHLKILNVNGENQTVQAFQDSLLDKYQEGAALKPLNQSCPSKNIYDTSPLQSIAFHSSLTSD